MDLSPSQGPCPPCWVAPALCPVRPWGSPCLHEKRPAHPSMSVNPRASPQPVADLLVAFPLYPCLLWSLSPEGLLWVQLILFVSHPSSLISWHLLSLEPFPISQAAVWSVCAFTGHLAFARWCPLLRLTGLPLSL